MRSLSGLLFFSLRRPFSTYHDVSIVLSFASRQTKHWNDCSSNTTPTFVIQEAVSPHPKSTQHYTNKRTIVKMELSPAFSITSDMTDEELDLYFATCGSLSNLPTPPPAKEHTIEKPSTTSDLPDFAAEFQGKLLPTIQHCTLHVQCFRSETSLLLVLIMWDLFG